MFYVSELTNENEIDNRAEVLLDLYSKLCRAFNARAYEIRAIVMPELPPGRLFVHNLERNLRESAENFSHKVVRTLTDAYNKNAKMQMIAASGDYTNEVTFNRRVKNIGWDNDCVSDSSLDNPNFRDVRIYYNSYESVPSTDKKDLTYSTVWITCGSKNGAGFLVKLKNCVVCVTCNHILAECNESKPMADVSFHEE